MIPSPLRILPGFPITLQVRSLSKELALRRKVPITPKMSKRNLKISIKSKMMIELPTPK